ERNVNACTSFTVDPGLPDGFDIKVHAKVEVRAPSGFAVADDNARSKEREPERTSRRQRTKIGLSRPFTDLVGIHEPRRNMKGFPVMSGEAWRVSRRNVIKAPRAAVCWAVLSVCQKTSSVGKTVEITADADVQSACRARVTKGVAHVGGEVPYFIS